MRRLAVLLLAAFTLAMSGCANEVEQTEAFQALNLELVEARGHLADVTAERDQLKLYVTELESQSADGACAAASMVRRDKAEATQAAIEAIIADPAAYGTEEEVLDALDALGAPGAYWRDTAFGGSIDWKPGWRNTLYGGTSSSIHNWTRWLSDDGSQGGALWTWTGTAANGQPFELHGISLDTYDEEGLVTSETVYYPMENADVLRAYNGGG
jgi:hypothetical protein